MTEYTYDAIGNPLTYRDGMIFTWEDGRKLSTMTKGTDAICYTYGEDGLRTSKAVNGTTTEYFWLNGILYAQKKNGAYSIMIQRLEDLSVLIMWFQGLDNRCRDIMYIHTV